MQRKLVAHVVILPIIQVPTYLNALNVKKTPASLPYRLRQKLTGGPACTSAGLLFSYGISGLAFRTAETTSRIPRAVAAPSS
jgi:hypothetical protein